MGVSINQQRKETMTDRKMTPRLLKGMKMQTLGGFHTPENMRELENWIEKTRDPLVLTGAMMMFNLLTERNNEIIDEVLENWK